MSYGDIQSGLISKEDYMRNQAQASQQIAGGLSNVKPQLPIRERIQEANERADTIHGTVMHLLNMVQAPSAIMGLSKGESDVVSETTLTTDVEDLARKLSNIAQQVDRLSAAILG